MFIGTVAIPGGLAALLMALPFLDRSPERHPAHRKTAMGVAIIMLVLLAGLSLMGYMEHFATPHP